jgi:hypothetical protein
VNKIGWVTLILITCVVIAGGVYWYYEFRPVGRLFSKPVAPIESVATTQARVEQTRAAEPKEEQVSKPTFEQALPEEEPVVTTAAPAQDKEVADEQPEIKPAAISAPAAVKEERAEPVVTTLPEKPETRTPNAIDIQQAIPLLQKASAPSPPSKEIEVPTVAKEAPADRPVVVQEEEIPPNPVIEEPQVVVIEEHDSDLADEEPEVTIIHVEEPLPPVEVEKDPLTIMGGKERELQDLGTVDISLQLAALTLPASTGDFTGEVQVLVRHKDSPLSLGGTIGVGKKGTQVRLNTLFTATYTFKAEETFSFPLYLSLGPSLILGSPFDWGFMIEAGAGVSLALLPDNPNFRFFVKAGAGASWYNKGGWALYGGPIRLGFSYSF